MSSSPFYLWSTESELHCFACFCSCQNDSMTEKILLSIIKQYCPFPTGVLASATVHRYAPGSHSFGWLDSRGQCVAHRYLRKTSNSFPIGFLYLRPEYALAASTSPGRPSDSPFVLAFWLKLNGDQQCPMQPRSSLEPPHYLAGTRGMHLIEICSKSPTPTWLRLSYSSSVMSRRIIIQHA